MARLNENENENENESTVGAGLFRGARFNTYKILKQGFDPQQPLFPQTTSPTAGRSYRAMGSWDAEDFGWVYILEFIRLKPRWLPALHAIGERFRTSPQHDFTDDAILTAALQGMVDAAGEREDRFAEILHQQDADGCITYFRSFANIHSSTHPHTYALLRFARKLGEMIVMALKAEFDEMRPSQICPSLAPMFDPPQTATFPAGHALQ